MKKKMYAVYLNDEPVAIGSAKKLARELGIKHPVFRIFRAGECSSAR